MFAEGPANCDILTGWLRDAYAMENGIVEILERHEKEAEHRPEIRQQVTDHLAQTRRHAELLEQRIRALGESPSRTKGVFSDLVGRMQGWMTAFADDVIVKNCIAEYAMEHFEIASYRSLIAGAQACGDTETARLCERILQEELRMAELLEGQLPGITQQYLSQPGERERRKAA